MFRYLIDNAWFNGILKRHFSSTIYSRGLQRGESDKDVKEINNSPLISNKMEVYNNINDNKQNFDLIEAMYTGTVLNDDIILNADYTIVNKEMFEHICKQLGYKCNNIIMR